MVSVTVELVSPVMLGIWACLLILKQLCCEATSGIPVAVLSIRPLPPKTSIQMSPCLRGLREFEKIFKMTVPKSSSKESWSE